MQPTITIQNLWPTVALAIGITFTALILTIEHWIPASTEWTFRQRYVAGTIAIWIGATVWRLLVGDIWTPIGLALIDAIGGATVNIVYRIDNNERHAHQARSAERNDPELTLS